MGSDQASILLPESGHGRRSVEISGLETARGSPPSWFARFLVPPPRYLQPVSVLHFLKKDHKPKLVTALLFPHTRCA